MPNDGYWGDWSVWSDTNCKDTFLNGAQIEILEKQWSWDDDRGATNLKMSCGDGSHLEGTNNDATR